MAAGRAWLAGGFAEGAKAAGNFGANGFSAGDFPASAAMVRRFQHPFAALQDPQEGGAGPQG
ncbi:hypothetical protein AVEN_235913-1, partial [Araneus ventricosus]